MAWIIDVDHHPEGPPVSNFNATGLRSNKHYIGDYPLKFRIYDDDGDLYYSGRATDHTFAPLDWACGNAGATEIKYFNPKTNKWETL